MSKCTHCQQTHPRSYKKRQQGRLCVFSDDPKRVSKSNTAKLARLRGLPDDCPGCLGSGTIERATAGRAKDGIYHTHTLTCRDCGVIYHEETR